MPESATSHWYFWGMARNFQAQDPELTARIREGQGKFSPRTWRCWSGSSRICWRIRNGDC